jgi:hypothetical protein
MASAITFRSAAPSARTWCAIRPREEAKGELSRSNYPVEPMDLANMPLAP